MSEQTKTPLRDWLDSQEFYEYFQQYRHAPDAVASAGFPTAQVAFEVLKEAIEEHSSERKAAQIDALRDALKDLYDQCDSLDDYKFTRDVPHDEAQQNWDDARYMARKALGVAHE